MAQKIKLTLLAALLGAAAMGNAQAYDGDWKRGRIYFRSVCTSCHVASPVGQINPSAKTKAVWGAYLDADKHAKGKETVKQYVAKDYRAKIKASNKAADKFADVPDAELMTDIRVFLLRSAKDGESPASCN